MFVLSCVIAAAHDCRTPWDSHIYHGNAVRKHARHIYVCTVR